MKTRLLVIGLCMIAGATEAQVPVDGSRRPQDQLRRDRLDGPTLRHDSRDARQLEELQRLRSRSLERSQRLRQQGQASRPVGSKNSNKNTVVTQ